MYFFIAVSGWKIGVEFGWRFNAHLCTRQTFDVKSLLIGGLIVIPRLKDEFACSTIAHPLWFSRCDIDFELVIPAIWAVEKLI